MIGKARFWLIWGWLAIPGAAYAHSPIKGIDSLYNGLLHPLLVPAHLLLLIALGLFIGQQGAKENLTAVVVFLISTLIGLAAAWFPLVSSAEIVVLASAAVMGIILAIKPKIGKVGCSFIAAFAGMALGMDSPQEALEGKEKLAALFGTGIGIYLLLLYPLILADHFNKKEWQLIAVRVVGSWVAASSFLVVALSFVPKV